MLLMCEQLAAGLGASAAAKNSSAGVPGEAVGNARLGLWVGQKFLGETVRFVSGATSGTDRVDIELYKRAGKEERVQKQIAANQRYEDAVRRLAVRGGVGGKTSDG